MILYDPAFGMPLLGSSNCGCQKIYKAVLLRVTQGLTNQNLIYLSSTVLLLQNTGFLWFPYISYTFFWASKIIFYLPSKIFYLSRAAGQWICQALVTTYV